MPAYHSLCFARQHDNTTTMSNNTTAHKTNNRDNANTTAHKTNNRDNANVIRTLLDTVKKEIRSIKPMQNYLTVNDDLEEALTTVKSSLLTFAACISALDSKITDLHDKTLAAVTSLESKKASDSSNSDQEIRDYLKLLVTRLSDIEDKHNKLETKHNQLVASELAHLKTEKHNCVAADLVEVERRLNTYTWEGTGNLIDVEDKEEQIKFVGDNLLKLAQVVGKVVDRLGLEPTQNRKRESSSFLGGGTKGDEGGAEKRKKYEK